MADEQPSGVFDPERIVRTLDRHGVDYVLIGGVAARLHGSPILTEDVDVTPERSRDNLRRLAEALAELNAKLAAPGADGGLDVDAETFSSPVMKFVTQAGEIDVVLDPQGSGGYEDLHRSAVDFQVFGIRLHAASLEDIITSKELSGRPKDRAHLENLRELADELHRQRELDRDIEGPELGP